MTSKARVILQKFLLAVLFGAGLACAQGGPEARPDAAQASGKPPSAGQEPAPQVPAACAAFAGGWTGDWPVQGRSYLWVMNVDPECNASVAYGRQANPPSRSQRLVVAPIKDGVLYLRRPDGGTTEFTLRESSLDARYFGPAGSNATSMTRIHDPAAAAREQAAALAASAPVPPSADVPADCAGFFGHWKGQWNMGSLGVFYFRVDEVRFQNGKCAARYSYSPSASPPPATEWTQIQGRTASVPCGPGRSETCELTRSGDEISATAPNNSGSFLRVR